MSTAASRSYLDGFYARAGAGTAAITDRHVRALTREWPFLRWHGGGSRVDGLPPKGHGRPVYVVVIEGKYLAHWEVPGGNQSLVEHGTTPMAAVRALARRAEAIGRWWAVAAKGRQAP